MYTTQVNKGKYILNITEKYEVCLYVSGTNWQKAGEDCI